MMFRIDIFQAASDGWTPLMAASRYGGAQTVKLLLNHPRIDVNMANDFGDTALIIASFWGSVEVVRALLQCPMTDIGIKGWKERTALETAKEKTHKGIAESIEHRSELLQRGNSTCPHSDNSARASKEPLETSNITASALAEPSPCDNLTHDFLAHVADGKLKKLERIVLQCPEFDEKVVNARPRGKTALHWAVDKDKPKLVQALLEQPNIDPNKEGGLNNETPLMAAAAFHQHGAEMVKLLLADPRYA